MRWDTLFPRAGTWGWKNTDEAAWHRRQRAGRLPLLAGAVPGGQQRQCARAGRRYDGSTAAYIGVLADDGAGLHFASALREEGVDISRVRVMHGISARNYIELDEAGDRHFVGNNGRETAQYQALLCLTPGDYAMMEQYDLAHTSIHSWLDAYHPAISRRVPLSLDFSGEYDRVNIAQLCPLLRFAFFSGRRPPARKRCGAGPHCAGRRSAHGRGDDGRARFLSAGAGA